MRWLQLSAISLLLMALMACEQAPEVPAVSTQLTVLSPWDNTQDGIPVLESLNTPLRLTYQLSNEANEMEADSDKRFNLKLNSVEVDLNDTAITVSQLGNGGEIFFADIASLYSALVSGINTLTLAPVNGAPTVSIEFIFNAFIPELVITDVTPVGLTSGTVLPGQNYVVKAQVMGNTRLKTPGSNNLNGVSQYDIQFFDSQNQAVDSDRISVSEDGKRVEVILSNYPDIDQSVITRPDFSHKLYDGAGFTQEKGWTVSGRQTKNAFAMQVSPSFFNAMEPVVNPMIEKIVSTFVALFPQAIEPFPRNEDGQKAEVGGNIVVSAPFPGTETFLDAACNDFLTNTPENIIKDCAFYANIEPLKANKKPRTNFGFDREEDEDGNIKRIFRYDIIIPELMINIDLAAYEPLFANSQSGTVTGNYLGSFRTTIVFKDLALSDSFTLNADGNAFIGGIGEGKSNGYRMRYTNALTEALSEIFFGSEQFSPQLINSSCEGDICLVPAEFIELANNLGGAASRAGLIDAMEAGLNAFLPDILSSLIASYPDFGGIKDTVKNNDAEVVVSREDNKEIVRHLSADYASVKASRDAGVFRFVGDYKVLQDNELNQDVVTPFINPTKFDDLNDFVWGKNKPGTEEQVDMVLSFSVNTINQWLASQWQMDKVNETLNREWVVDSSSDNTEINTLSRMVREFDALIDEDDNVALLFDVSQPPTISLVGGKESKWQYAYSFLFGIIQGGESDTMVTPAIKLSFHDADVQLIKKNNNQEKTVFDVNADFSIEANVTYENGVPKFYVVTPQAPQAEFEEDPEKRLNKQLIIDVNQVNYVDPAIIKDPMLVASLSNGIPNDPNDSQLGIQISNAFTKVYKQQMTAYLVNGKETFFDQLLDNYIQDNFTKTVKFRDYRCEDLKVQIFDVASISYSLYLHQLFANTRPILVQGNMRWFTTDESGAFIHTGIDFNTRELAEDTCPETLPPFSACFTAESLQGEDPACESR